jgi:hypothetical protein
MASASKLLPAWFEQRACSLSAGSKQRYDWTKQMTHARRSNAAVRPAVLSVQPAWAFNDPTSNLKVSNHWPGCASPYSQRIFCVCRFYGPILIKCDMRQLAKCAAHPVSCCHLHVPIALYKHKLLRRGEGNLHYCQLSLHVSAMHVLRASLFSTHKRYVTHNADSYHTSRSQVSYGNFTKTELNNCCLQV